MRVPLRPVILVEADTCMVQSPPQLETVISLEPTEDTMPSMLTFPDRVIDTDIAGAVGAGVTEGMGVGVTEGEGVGDGVVEGDGVGVGVIDGIGVGVLVGVAVGVGEAVIVGVGVGEGVGDTV
jgi:hypothetical protein